MEARGKVGFARTSDQPQPQRSEPFPMREPLIFGGTQPTSDQPRPYNEQQDSKRLDYLEANAVNGLPLIQGQTLRDSIDAAMGNHALDAPRPSGEQEWVCGKCGASATKPDGRPSGQEWTPERISKLINDPALNGIALNKITDAFNVVLAAEREKIYTQETEIQRLCETITKERRQAGQQLAAEIAKRRELCAQAVKDVEALNASHDALEQQLAAKDELHAAALQVLERHHQKQLADEREQTQSALRKWHETHQQLCAAQAAIANYIKSNYNDLGRNYEALTSIDDTALRKHDAELIAKHKLAWEAAVMDEGESEYAGAWERRANKRGMKP